MSSEDEQANESRGSGNTAAETRGIVRRQIQSAIWVAVASGIRLARLDIITRSSHLAFLTIFAMVPLLVLAVALMRPLGLLENAQQDIHDFLATTGLTRIVLQVQEPPAATGPAHPSRVSLASQMERLIQAVISRLTVGRVGPIGVIVLAWAAISLVTTLEKTLNLIFGARQTRPLGTRLLLYWSVVTLVPITLAAVALPAEKAVSAIGTYGWLSHVVGTFAYIVPTLAGILIVAGIYKFLPNTYVPVPAALLGAAVAVPSWVIAKKGFGLYLKYVVVSGNIYGALGLLPVAMVYVNMSWLILLWGAQLAEVTYHGGRVHTRPVWELVVRPTDLLAVVLQIARHFHEGLGPVAFRELGRQVDMPDERVREILDYLGTRQLIHRVDDKEGGRYTLARPADRIRFLEVVEADTRLGLESLKLRYSLQTALTIFWLQDRAQARAGELTLADGLRQEQRPRG